MRNTIALELELRGEKVEGRLLVGEAKVPVEDGKYWKEERKIHFQIFFPANQLRYIADGTVGDDEIKGNWRHEKSEGTFELRREKKRASRKPAELLHSAEVRRFYSEVLGRDFYFAAYLPSSYHSSPDLRFPVVYFLHGLFENDGSWGFRGVADLVDRLRAEGKVGEFLVIAPRGGSGFWLDGKSESDQFETAIMRDLIPEVEYLYRVDATRKPALFGMSMGGYGALLFALKHPDAFSAVVAVNPALFEEIPDSAPREFVTNAIPQLSRRVFGDPFDRDYYEANHPLWLLRREPVRAKSLRMPIYITHAKEDQYGFLPGAKAFSEILNQNGVAHRFVVFEGTHEWRSTLPVLAEPLVFIWEALQAAPSTGR